MGTVAASTKYNTETHSIFPFSKYLLYNEVLKKTILVLVSLLPNNKSVEKESCKLWANSRTPSPSEFSFMCY